MSPRVKIKGKDVNNRSRDMEWCALKMEAMTGVLYKLGKARVQTLPLSCRGNRVLQTP